MAADLAPGDARAVSQAVNAFAFDLFGEVAGERQNTITAPLSMTVLLAMLLAGAHGGTAAEIAEVLHLSEPAWSTRWMPVSGAPPSNLSAIPLAALGLSTVDASAAD